MVNFCTDWAVLPADHLEKLKAWIEKYDKEHSLLLTPNGVFCRECGVHYKHHDYKGKYAKYISEPSTTEKEDDIYQHLFKSNRHRVAFDTINHLVYTDTTTYGDKFSSAVRASRSKKDDTSKLEKALVEKVKVIRWMVREMIANFQYKSLQALIDDVGKNEELKAIKHNSGFSFLEFLAGINSALKDVFFQELSKASEFSILLDECQDTEGIYQVAFWIVYLDQKNERQMKFMCLKDADSKGCTGEVLFDMLMLVLQEHGLDIHNMVGLGTDGASAMVGEDKGLRGRIHEVAPWVFAIHCAAHRLHLAAGDMLKPDQFKQLLAAQNAVKDVANFIHHGNRGAYFFELQGKYNKQYALPRPNDTRWWSMHKLIQVFMNRYGVILEAFETWRKDSEDAERIYQVIRTYKFVVDVSSLEVVMDCMTPLSKVLQEAGLTVFRVQDALNTTYEALDAAVRNKVVRKLVQDMLKQTTSRRLCGWCAISLTMDIVSGRFVQNSKLCIQRRFPSMQTIADLTVVFGPDNLRAARGLPGTQYEDVYGDEAWQRLVDQFFPHTRLGKDSKEYRDLIPDWHSVKVAIKWNLRASMTTADSVCRWILSNDRFCRTADDDYCVAYTALMLARIALVLPPTNAGVERGFSTMNDIKCAGRSRLSEPVLNKLMFVRLHTGEHLDTSVALAAVGYWLSERTRRGLKALEEADVEGLRLKVNYHREEEIDEVWADIKERIEDERGERIAE